MDEPTISGQNPPMNSRRLTFLQGLAFVSGVACSSSSSTDPSATDTGGATDAVTDTVTTDGRPADSTATDSTATDSTPTDGLSADSTTTDSTPTDSTAGDAPKVDAPGDAVVSDTWDGNKCRYPAGPAYTFLDCAPGRVCKMPTLLGPPTCEPGGDAGAPCGTIQCEGSCSCLDAAKSICDCFGAAIGPLAPPELAA